MKTKSLISINDYSKEDYFRILDLASKFQSGNAKKYLKDKIIASLFFEPSTRTRLSFETAVNRLGGRVVGFSEPGGTSLSKGESFKDTILTISKYADMLVIRHPQEGSARYASEISNKPVINAGDGSNQHPTQCLLDLYSILKTQHTLENLNLFLVGDLKYGRTVHSLLMAMSEFNPVFNFISPTSLTMPQEYKQFLDEKNIKYYEHYDINNNINSADIIYVTRVQRERFSDHIEYEKVKNSYVLKNQMLEGTKDNLKILHPLPRINEIDTDVDTNPKAYYFDQAENGVYVRMALMCYMFNENIKV